MATKWNLDTAHSEVTFKVRHMMITNVSGTIGKFDITAESDDDQFNGAKVEFSADLNSISTGDEKRDGHLKSPDFFDVENTPTMKFVSSSYANGKITGELTIRSVTKPVSFDVEFGGIGKDPWGQTKAGFTVSGKINRKDWGLEWNAPLETGGVLVSEDVKVNAEIQLIKA